MACISPSRPQHLHALPAPHLHPSLPSPVAVATPSSPVLPRLLSVIPDPSHAAPALPARQVPCTQPGEASGVRAQAGRWCHCPRCRCQRATGGRSAASKVPASRAACGQEGQWSMCEVVSGSAVGLTWGSIGACVCVWVGGTGATVFSARSSSQDSVLFVVMRSGAPSTLSALLNMLLFAQVATCWGQGGTPVRPRPSG